jgi:hypothetical protein
MVTVQAERYVNAIDYVPLWGLDMGTPNQHVLSDQPYGELVLKNARTTDEVVRRKFLPILKQLIVGINQADFEGFHQALYAELFVKLHLYFQEFDWLRSWDHEASKLAWYATWFDVLTDNWTSDRKVWVAAARCPLPAAAYILGVWGGPGLTLWPRDGPSRTRCRTRTGCCRLRCRRSRTWMRCMN